MVIKRRSLAILILASSGSLLLGATAAPVDMASRDFPTLSKELSPNSTAICPVRALRAAEIAPLWRWRVTNIRVFCGPRRITADGADYGVQVKARVSADMKPGLVTFYGVPVVRLREEWGEIDHSWKLYLAAPYRSIVGRLSALMRKDCAKIVPNWQNCRIDRGVVKGGIYIETMRDTAVELSPDPANPRQTIYTWGWSD